MKTIDIIGNIISDDYGRMYEKYGIASSYPAKIKQALSEANGDDVEININSGGGDVFAGFEIYTAILTYKGNVKINVTGLAASAASVIMCAADSFISPVGMIMIHCSSCYAGGNHNDLEKTADTLKSIDESIANAYVSKTGMSKEKALALMEETTWMTADKAVEMGLCNGYISKVNTAKSEEISADGKQNDNNKAKAKAKARFLTMRGENHNV